MRRFSRFRRALCRRYASQEGTVEKTITKSSKGKDGSSIFERINLTERISKLSPWQRRALGVYAALATGTFTFAVYNDGRRELQEHWTSDTYVSDWHAAKAGCKRNIGTHFWDSVFFPFTFVSDVMPYIVIGTTSKPEQD